MEPRVVSGFPTDFNDSLFPSAFDDCLIFTKRLAVDLVSDMERKYKLFYSYQSFFADNLAHNYPFMNEIWGEYRNLQWMFEYNNDVIRALIKRIDFIQRAVCIAEREFSNEIAIPLNLLDYRLASIKVPDYLIWL